jgi:hypothetical protein
VSVIAVRLPLGVGCKRGRSALCLFGMARIGKALDNPRQPTRPRRYPCNNAQLHTAREVQQFA